MIDLLSDLVATIGRLTDATSATGSLAARILETLNRFTTTVAGRIDASVSSRLSGTIINSIQSGTITTVASATTTATISSVTTSKATVRWRGTVQSSGAVDGRGNAWLDLTNSTTVTANVNGGASNTSVHSFEVTEHK